MNEKEKEKEFICNSRRFGFLAGECPDYGSMNCPKTVPGAKCGVDAQYAQELLESKHRYYARRMER